MALFTWVRTKTCTVPPCVYTGPAKLDELLNGCVCKFGTCLFQVPNLYTCTCIWAISLSFHFFVTLNTLPPSPRWQAKITQASAKLHAHREKVPYVIFSARENGWGLSFLRTLYSPYSVDRARTIATHQPAILNKYVWTLKDEKSYRWAVFLLFTTQYVL